MCHIQSNKICKLPPPLVKSRYSRNLIPHTISYHSYFRVGTPGLPAFYKTIWELSNDTVLHVRISKVKQNGKKAQEYMTVLCFEFYGCLLIFCLSYTNVHFLYIMLFDVLVYTMHYFVRNEKQNENNISFNTKLSLNKFTTKNF